MANTPEGTLEGIAALSPTDAWIVGEYGAETFVEHWDGASWSIVPSPNADESTGALNSLYAVARVPGTRTLWAVGSYDSYASNGTHPLILEAANG